MNIAYDVEFDLDAFLQSMDDPDRPAWRRIEDHMERRRLREQAHAQSKRDHRGGQGTHRGTTSLRHGIRSRRSAARLSGRRRVNLQLREDPSHGHPR